MNHNEETSDKSKCLYCGLEITNPRPNKYFHDASCCNMYYYWKRYEEKLDGAIEIIDKLRDNNLISGDTFIFIKQLTPTAITDIVFSMGYRWHYTTWVKKYPQPER